MRAKAEKILKRWSLTVAFVVCETACANNLQITNIQVIGRNETTAYVKFDISWENSWRFQNGGDLLYYHDAAWVFFKVLPDGRANWEHVILEGTGTNPTDYATGNGTPIEIVVPPDRVGLFVRRSEDGAGTISAQNLKVVWNIASNNLANTNSVKIQAFGIEMVYVAGGSFQVGDGTNRGFEAGISGTPFTITNEVYAITLGGGGEGSLGNNNGEGMYIPDDFNDQTARTLPASFPKGYAPFYCMKYEITQGQYADFLNTLTRAQQAERCTATNLNYYMSATPGGSLSSQYRNRVRLTEDPGPPYARIFTAERPDRSCNYISSQDLMAFADWAGLRPMTELEFEKACRGPLMPVANEYAWGTSTIMVYANLSISGEENGTETITTDASLGGCNYRNSSHTGGDGETGPLRAGIFATNNATRVSAGASYWGIMELSGNEWERTVPVGVAAARTFTGLHGDGVLTSDGKANVPQWPSVLNWRGGSWWDSGGLLRVSDRFYAADMQNYGRLFVDGGRAVRTAPF